MSLATKRRLVAVSALLFAAVAFPQSVPAALAEGVAERSDREAAPGAVKAATRLFAAVDADALRRELRAELIEDVRRTIVREARIGVLGIVLHGDGLRVSLRDASRLGEALAALEGLKLAEARAVEPGVGEARYAIAISLREAEFRRRLNLATDRAVDGVRRRAEVLGVTDAVVARVNATQIRFEAPATFDVQRFRSLVVDPAAFWVQLVLPRESTGQDDGSEERIAPSSGRAPERLLVRRAPILSSGDVVHVRSTAEGETIEIEPNAAAARRLADISDIANRRFVLSFGDEAVAITRIAPLASGRYGLTLAGLSSKRAAELAAAMHGMSPEPQLVWLTETNAPRADNPLTRVPK